MPFNIDAFKTNIEDSGYLLNNKFTLYVLPPPILGQTTTLNPGQATTSEISRLISFRADQIRTPNINISAAGINRYGVGPIQKQPFSAEFNDISVSLVSDGNAEIWQFWHNWLRSIFQFTGTENPTGTVVNGIANYYTYYKDEYSTMMSILIYDQYGQEIQKIDLLNAFPVSLSPVQLSWGTSDLLRISVNITYKEYIISGSSLNTPTVQSIPTQPQSVGVSRIITS